MTTTNLSDFFRQKRAHAGAVDIDWDRRKADWIAAVQQLYEEIQLLLQGPISEGAVTVDRRPKSITEDFLGTYTVDELVLRVGDEFAVFSPKGRNIVGASGRVDFIGEMGEATLVLQPGPRWSVVSQRVPVLKLVPLEQESLLATLS